MLSSSLRTLVRRLFASSRPARRPVRSRLRVEALEDRLLLSTRVWDGSADGSGAPFANANWSSPPNWVGDVAPVAGDDLQFPAGALQQTATNDFPAGTAFNSIAISGSGYQLGGNAVRLAAGITTSNATGTDTVGMSLTLTASQTITSGTAGTDLVLSGPVLDNRGFRLTVAGPGDVLFSGGTITGDGGLTKNGTGQLVLADTAPNAYTGSTRVNGGTLLLLAPAGNAIVGPLVVGGGTSGAVAAIARLSAAGQVANDAPVTVNGTGLFDLNGFDDTVGPLTLSGGRVTTGTGTLTLNGDVTTVAAGAVAKIDGHLNLGTGTPARTFTVPNGTVTPDLDVTATVAGAADVQLVKQGPGRLLLEANNGYAGPTVVAAGTLAIDRARALGSVAAGTTVNSGATLLVQNPLDNQTYTFAAEPLTLNGSGDPLLPGGGALLGTGDCDTAIWPGQVTLASGSVLAQTSSTALNLTGLVTGPGSLTKTGTGEILLSHANDYSGVTLITQGILTADNPSSLGATGPASGTTVRDEGVLQLEGGLTFDPEALTLRGTGSGGSSGGKSALHSEGSNTWTGPITLAAPSQVNVTTGDTLTLSGPISGGTNNGLVVGRSIASGDHGTVLLTAANTYAGQTTVSVGTLAVRNATALGSPTSVANQGTTVKDGATLRLEGGLTFDPTEALALNGTGVNDAGALVDGSGDDTWAGPVTLASSASVGAAGGTTLTVAGVIGGLSGSRLTKAGSGTVVLPVGNLYAGPTFVAAGTLVVQDPAALGAVTAGTTVCAGATLQLQGGVAFNAEPLTLNGDGVGGSAGALRSRGGANTWSGSITLGSAATVRADAGGPLTVTGAVANHGYLLTADARGDATFGNTISGSGGLTKNGAGTLTFAGAAPNGYAGLTTVNAGTLLLARAAGIPAIAGNVVVNAGGTLAGSGTVSGDVTNAGTVTVGGAGAAGTLVIGGNYTQTAAGVLNVEVAGPTSCDRLAVAGKARLGGTLNVALLGGFVPAGGSAFQVLTFASSGGSFATLTGVGGATGLALAYDATDVSVVAR